jgi:pimeloyl-ACP methyl ester carboxylesterase
MSRIVLEDDCGSGRVFCLLTDDPSFSPLATEVRAALRSTARVVSLKAPVVTDSNWQALAVDLQAVVQLLETRQVSFVAFGATAALVLSVALEEPKLVRTLALVDPTARPHPTTWNSIIDRIESALPLGLPLRAAAKAFDARACIHRIRCPLLLAASPSASPFVRAQVLELSQKAPTCWTVSMTNPSNSGQELADILSAFQDVPVRCPQKNVESRVGG